MEFSMSLIEGLLTLAIGGGFWWMWRSEDARAKIKEEMNELKVDLAKNYHSKEELRKVVDDALFPMWKEMERLARAVEKLGDEE